MGEEIVEVPVTQDQYNRTWNMMPPTMRYNVTDCPKAKDGFVVMPIGNLRVWVDQYLPTDYVDEKIETITQTWDKSLAAKGLIDEQKFREERFNTMSEETTTPETPATPTTESEPVAADPTQQSSSPQPESSSSPALVGTEESTTSQSTEPNPPSPSDPAPSSSGSPTTAPEPTPAAVEEPSEPVSSSTSTPAVVEQVNTETAVAEAKAAISTLLVHGETLFAAANDELAHAQEVLAILQTSSAAGFPGTIVSNSIEKLAAHVAGLEAAVNDFKAKTGKN